MADVLSESRPCCDLCGQRIPRGVQYTRTTLAEWRDIWDWRECAPCQDVARYTFEWLDYPYDPITPADADEWAGDALRSANTSNLKGKPDESHTPTDAARDRPRGVLHYLRHLPSSRPPDPGLPPGRP